MVLPIGFFAPLPLAIMIPFMAAQSFAMGQAFGTSFQYGKRKISSMSNEEFNAITAVELADNLQSDVRAMIPSMTESFHRMETFQIEILESMVRTFIKAAESFFQFIGPGSGVNPYVGTGSNAAIDDFSGEDIPGFIPTADASDSSGTTKFVSDYITEARALPFNLLADIVEKMLSGKLTQPIERRIAYIQVYKERLPKTTPDDAATAIDKATTAGSIAHTISTMFAQIRSTLASSMLKTPNHMQYNQFVKELLAMISKFNRYVTSTRNPATGKTFANLQIDSAKSIKARRIISKT